TGGRDLTLFEVDEAATRIREEVDPDANIILGATFEESLEGVIRVSVVATGIESDVREEDAPADLRTQEMAARMKAAAQAAAPQAPRPANVQTEARAPVQPAAPAFRPAAPQQAPVQHHAPAQPAMRDPGVTIAPLAPP